MLPWHSAKLIHLKFGLCLKKSMVSSFFFLPIILAFKKKKLNMYFPEEKMKASKKEFIIQTGSWVNAEIACC